MLTHRGGVKEARLEAIREAMRQLTPRGMETDVERFADFLRLQSPTDRFSATEVTKASLFEDATSASPHHHYHHEGERAFTAMRVPVPFVVERRGDRGGAAGGAGAGGV